MTTLALDTPRDFELGDRNEFPVIASDIIYEGSAVGLVKASGHARPLTSADQFVGFCEKQADNSSGLAAAINVRVIKKGSVKLAVSGAVITDVGQPVYATDDNVFVFTPVSSVFIGFVRRWISSGYVIVEFDAENFKDPHDGFVKEALAASTKTLDAQDSGKAFYVTVTSVITLPSIEGMSGIRLICGGAYGTVQISASPAAGDMIEGPDISAANDKDIINTLATACRGDYIDLDYSDANGWVITAMKGTWAREG